MSVELDEVSQGYGHIRVIESMTVTFRAGITALLGPNGAGKTTLLRTLATIMPPRTGKLMLDGARLFDESDARRAREHIGYLPQEFGFDPRMSVADFVAYAAWARGLPSTGWSEVVAEALAMVDLTDRRKERMGKLSGGMRQRAGIAWAVVGRPRLVLLDEPTVGLDPRQRLQFRNILTKLKDTVVVLSTHLIDDVGAVCDRVVVIHAGSIKFDGTVSDMEALSRDDLPGHSMLERAYMRLHPDEEQQL